MIFLEEGLNVLRVINLPGVFFFAESNNAEILRDEQVMFGQTDVAFVGSDVS